MRPSKHLLGFQCFCLAFLCGSANALSQEFAQERFPSTSLRADVPLNKQLHRGYSMTDGLPSNWINDVIQTSDDYLWIATDNGLARYDGLEFRVFRKANTPQLPRNEIRKLFESRDGSIWIGTTNGLTRFKPERPGRFDEIPSLSGCNVLAIYEDKAGRIWVGTSQATYMANSGIDFKIVNDAPINVRAICEDQRGTHWFGSNYGLFRYQGTTYEQIAHERLPSRSGSESGVPQSRINIILATDDGDLWIGTNRALLHRRNGQFTSLGQELESQQIYDILPTRDGGLVVAARFGIFRSVKNRPFEQISDRESAFSVIEDKDGGLWVGHGDNRGLHYYRNRPAEVVWNETRVRCLQQDSQGPVWFGSSMGLHRFREGKITTYGLEAGLPDLRVKTIVPGSGDSFWIGTGQGIVKWTGKELVNGLFTSATKNMNIGAAFEDTSGNLWFSLSSFGARKFKNGMVDSISELENGHTHWFWEDPQGTIWIGHDQGLFQSRNGTVQKVKNGLDPIDNCRFICHFILDDTLWMGTSHGIVRFHSGQFDVFEPECGLRADNIERMVADEDGNLWYGGRDGLFCARLSELDAFSEGRLDQVASYRVDGFDRFPPLGAYSQGCLVRDGELWIIGEDGLMKMAVEPYNRSPPPPVVQIDRVAVNGLSVGFEDQFEFQSGRRRLSIQFSVPSWIHQEQIQVRFRLDGYDEHWNSAGINRIADYTDLRPGHYKFLVMAKNGNGEWRESDLPLSFRVLPRWWELIWVRAVGVLFLVVASIGYTQHRVREIRESNENLRREIADRRKAEGESRQHFEQLARVSRAATMGELTTSIAHEVNQPLFAIVSNAQTARHLLDREAPDIGEIREALKDIANDGNRASSIIDRIRSLVKKEQPKMDRLDLNDVARDVVKLVESELTQRGISLVTAFADDLPSVLGDRIELQQVILNFLINGAEAMNESESDDRYLTIRTSANEGLVELSVVDQGIGINEEVAAQIFEPFFTTKQRGTGMGLALNRTIVRAHGGSIEATSNRQNGATFSFRLPMVAS